MPSPPDPEPEKSDQSEDPPRPRLIARAIPVKWIIGAILAYMIIYNLILFLNSR